MKLFLFILLITQAISIHQIDQNELNSQEFDNDELQHTMQKGKIFKSFSHAFEDELIGYELVGSDDFGIIVISSGQEIQETQQLIEPTEYQLPKLSAAIKQEKQNQIEELNTKYYEALFDGQESYKFQFEDKLLQDTDEYGYGFWLRPSSTIPKEHKRNPTSNYFISRLTSNKDYQDNTLYGDRTLLIYLQNNNFIFSTYDIASRQKSKEEKVIFDNLIDDSWFFISYSYSAIQKQAVAYIVAYNQIDKYLKFIIPCVHQPPTIFTLIIGGKQFNYQGFNGQFANIFYDFDTPAFIGNDEDLKQILLKISKEPQSLSEQIQLNIIEQPQEIKHIEKEYKSDLIITQYSIAGWFRWTGQQDIKEITNYQIFNLRTNKERNTQLLGDNVLQILYNIGGGKTQQEIYYQTYTINGNNGNGQKNQQQSALNQYSIWNYIYFAYDLNKQTAYGINIKPGYNHQIKLNPIIHKQSTEFYFTIGSDQLHQGFQGIVTKVQLSLGPNSYREGLEFKDTFQYGSGAIQIFQLGSPISIEENAQNIINVMYDQEESVIKKELIHDDEKLKINGQSEYGFGLWTRWMTTIPKYLDKSFPAYNVARFGTNKDPKTIKSNTLNVNLEEKSFEFSTYNENQRVEGDIEFKANQLEGQWNYIYFGYKRNQNKGIAQGFIQFNDEIKQIKFDVFHDYLIDYAEFIISKSVSPLFNGQMTQIRCLIGPGSFIENEKALQDFTKNSLPPNAILQQNDRITIPIIKGIKQIVNEQDQLQMEFEKCQGIEEYSISGWSKWEGDQITGKKFNLVSVTDRLLKDFEANSFTLQIQRLDKIYQFSSNNCENNDCSKGQQAEESFEDNWNQWIYIYFGYSKQQKKAFGFVKYSYSDSKIELTDVLHKYVSILSIKIGGKVGILEHWQGSIKSWVLNVGKDSYKENDYEKGEDNNFNFGYLSGTEHHQMQQNNQEAHKEQNIIESSQDKEAIHLEFKQSDKLYLNGVSEYGYGYWMRFQYFSKSKNLYLQPQWMGISRLTTNKDYQDFQQPGDRVLVVLLGKEQFLFSTYSPISNAVNAHISYQIEWESEWTYIYFSYKRIDKDKGQAQGFIYVNEQTNGIQIDALHKPLDDYLQLTVGHAGKNYPNLNGQISQLRMNLGNGAYINNKEKLIDKIKNVDRIPQIINLQKNLQIIEGKKDSNGIQIQNPITIEEECREYSVSMWFKWNRITNPNQLIYRFTTSSPLSDNINFGDRTLMLSRKNKIEFSTYDLQDTKEWKDSYQCEIPLAQQEIWTFTYFAYSKLAQKAQYYLKAEDFICKGNEETLHLVGQKYFFYLGKDGILDNYVGSLAQVDLNLGDKSYRTDDFDKLPTFLISNVLFPTDFKFLWENDKEVILSTEGETSEKQFKVKFESTEEQPFDMVTEYAVGFWTRFSTTLPRRQWRTPQEMQIIRLSGNEKTQEGKIELGDRILAIHLVLNNYQFSTYDINDNAPNEISLIKYIELEGQWNYLYMGYSRSKQMANYYLYDINNKVQTAKNTNLLHTPLEKVIHLILGGEETIPSFQGTISEIAVQFGKGAFVETQEEIVKAIQTTFALSPSLLNQHKLNTGKLELKENFETTDKVKYVNEYSISGWIKVSQQTSNECQLLFRVTNNDKEHLGDRKGQGDRVFYGSICNNKELTLSTYTLMEIKDWNEPKFIEEKEELGNSNYAWIYLYMGYDNYLNELHSLANLFDRNKSFIWKNIQHFVPNTLDIYLGQDTFTPKFNGILRQWELHYGIKSFINLANEEQYSQLPNINLIKVNQQYNWFQQKSDVNIGEQLKQEFDQTVVDSISEYSVGLWTKWLYAFPTQLTKRNDYHSIFRLTSIKEYNDKSKLGDRVLHGLVGLDHYLLSTYDQIKQLTSIESKIDFVDLEGEWNYIYTSYSNKQFYGAIYYSNKDKIEEIKQNVSHKILVGYAQLILNEQQFGYNSFHGYLFDPRVNFGQGIAIQESQKLKDMIQKIHRKLPAINVEAEDFKWPIDILDTTINQQLKDNEDKLYFKFNDKKEITEYAIGIWIQNSVLQPGQEDNYRLIARLSTNPENQINEQVQMGDNTLTILTKSNEIQFISYKLKGSSFESTTNTISILPYQWTYIYFAYGQSKGYAYVLTTKEPIKQQFDLNHIIPNDLYLSLIKANHHNQFLGKIYGIKLLFGKGSVLDDPSTMIEKYPYQQLNSVKPIELQMNLRKQ